MLLPGDRHEVADERGLEMIMITTTPLTPTRARHHAATCCVPGCDLPRYPITPKRRSRFCEAHYRTGDQRLRSCDQRNPVTTDAALETLHQLRPPKPIREYPGTSLKWGVDMTEHAMKCKVWHRDADTLIGAKGGTVRPPRELDDASRAAALARLDALTAARMERSA